VLLLILKATARSPANRLALLPALIHERLGSMEFSEVRS
jgi:hypothetical protein